MSQRSQVSSLVVLWKVWLLVRSDQRTNQGTRSPIELFWTAKNDMVDKPSQRQSNHCCPGSVYSSSNPSSLMVQYAHRSFHNLPKTCKVVLPTVVGAAEHVSMAVLVIVTVAIHFHFARRLPSAAVPVLNQVSSIFSNRKTSTEYIVHCLSENELPDFLGGTVPYLMMVWCASTELRIMRILRSESASSLASQDALEVTLVTHWLQISIDLPDVSLVSDDN